MEKLNSFFQRNESTISFIRWVVFPIAVAACFFALDGRYVQKGDWTQAMAEQRTMTQTLSIDQKLSINKLTDAITVLATEQRNVAELQRVNGNAISAAIGRFDKHEVADNIKWDKLEDTIKGIDGRIKSLEIVTTKLEVTSPRQRVVN